MKGPTASRTKGGCAVVRCLLGLTLALSLPAWPLACASPDASRATASLTATLDAADLSLARGRMQAAEDGYRSVLEARPDDARALAGLARVALARGEIEAALAWDDRAHAAGRPVKGGFAPRERCALWQAVAEQRLALGTPDVGEVGELIERLEADPVCSRSAANTLRARSLLLEARTAYQAGETDAALAACREASAADPTIAEVDGVAARWLLDAGRRQEALAWLGQALARHPDDVGLRLLMLEALGVPLGAETTSSGGPGRAGPVP